MAKIFITGSADGLGQLAAQSLIDLGHRVVLHARNEKRSKEALEKVPGAESVLTADLSSPEETIQLASKVNDLETFDAVIHNAGVYNAAADEIISVNTLAPYILTCLIKKPKRLVYVSSELNEHGRFRPEDFQTGRRHITYSDSKLHILMLCKAAARKWSDVYANSINPGWVPTKMGGIGAPDDLQKGYETQVWLAVSNDEKAKVSGRCFYHQKEIQSNPEADDELLQEKLLDLCKKETGVSFQ